MMWKEARRCCWLRDSRIECWGKRKRSSVAPVVVNWSITGRFVGAGGGAGGGVQVVWLYW